MKQKEIENFIYFLTNSKNLTKAQRLKRDQLLAKTCISPEERKPTVDKFGAFHVGHCPPHDTASVVNFLHQFTEGKSLALKYTTHFWDKDISTGEYPYSNFNEFKEAYLKILNDKNSRPLESIRLKCDHLWQTVKNFLVNTEAKYTWSEFKLKIGYNIYLEKWMNENPGIQPFSMPISAFPEEVRPKSLINGKTLVYFNDAVEIFKHCIEFRDNDLYFAVKKIFSESPDFIINQDFLKTLRGKTFYTDTELVKDALRIIAHNIFSRPAYPHLEIKSDLVNDENGQRVVLKILQIDSFSDKDILDPKIIANTDKGDLSRIKAKLENLCDFSVESRFSANGEFKPCRINYLTSKKDGEDMVVEIAESDCRGFTYILTFYISNHE